MREIFAILIIGICTITFMITLANHLPPTQEEIIAMEMR